jgi:hypothetical protein
MRVVGVVCIVVGLAFIIGLRFTGRSERAAAAWTPYNKVMAGFAGVVAIIAGVLLLVGGVE